MKNIICISLFIFLGVSEFSFSQEMTDEIENTKVGKLKGELDRANNDTTKIKILYELASELSLSNSLLAKNYLEQALYIAINNNYSYYIAKTNSKIGVMYRESADYEKSMYYAIKSIKLWEKLKDTTNIINENLNVGNIYRALEKLDKSLSYYKIAYSFAEDSRDSLMMLKLSTSIGTSFMFKGEAKSAKYFYEKALIISEKLKNNSSIPIIKSGLAGIYRGETNGFSKALRMLKEAVNVFVEQGDRRGEADLLSNIAVLFAENNQPDSALIYFQESLKIATETKYKDLIISLHADLHEFYKQYKDYEKSLSYLEKYNIMNDSIMNNEKSKQIIELETKYQTEKKEQELVLKNKDIELLEKDKKVKNYLLLGFGALLIMAIGLTILSYRNYKQKQKAAELKTIAMEQKLLRLQMNPHFIFNSLSSISGQMLHNLNAARDYLAKFARLMRLILENSREAYVTMKSEVDTLNYYMILEQQRFKDKFDFKIDIDPKLQIDETEIPPMLIQPHIENAILHGIVPKEEKGLIEVRFTQETETSIRCEIEDNGIGRKKSAEKKSDKGYVNHKSLALEITKERLETLSEETHQTLSFRIEDLEDEKHNSKGTKVVLVLPCKTV